MRKKHKHRTCTYSSPTYHADLNDTLEVVKTNFKKIPMVTHIHGLEVRPTFDGNPLSWIANEGELGVGY